MAKREQSSFDFEEHERMLAERYSQLARYRAFDALVDLALDGQIEMGEAIGQFITESENGVVYGEAT